MPYPYTNPLAGSIGAPQFVSRPQLSYSDFKGHSKDYFMGIHCGYVSGGQLTPGLTSTVQRYNFSNYSATAASVASLTRSVSDAAGASAFRYIGFNNYGLTAGGYAGLSFPSTSNIIDRFPFSIEGSATDVGDLSIARFFLTGLSSPTKGYFSGGTGSGTTYHDTIDSVPLYSTVNATSVGNLTAGRYSIAGCSSESKGYSCGGLTSPPGSSYNIIDSFPFATTANASDVGDLTTNDTGRAGISGTDKGFVVGSFNSTSPTIPTSSRIQSFPFAVNNNAYNVGQLSVTRSDGAGFSSTTSAYLAGGKWPSSPVNSDVVDRFPLTATSGTAVDVGDLATAVRAAAGLQN